MNLLEEIKKRNPDISDNVNFEIIDVINFTDDNGNELGTKVNFTYGEKKNSWFTNYSKNFRTESFNIL